MQESFQTKTLLKMNSKENIWSSVSQSLDLIRDRLGKPIDPGIKEICIAFTVNDLPTTQSCEGHLDEGLPYPWVDIGPQYEDFGPDLNKKRGFVDSAYRSSLEKSETLTREKFQVDEIDYEDTEMMLFFDTTLEASFDLFYHQYYNEVWEEEKRRTENYIIKLDSIFKTYMPLDIQFAYNLSISYSKTRIRIEPIHAKIFKNASVSEKQTILKQTSLEMSHVTKLFKDAFLKN